MYPESSLLETMGVSLTNGPVPIPLYAQKTMQLVPDRNLPGLAVYKAVDVDPELQSLMSLLLQVVDGRAFRRFVHEKEIRIYYLLISNTMFTRNKYTQ
jgi:hypothetical protein